MTIGSWLKAVVFLCVKQLSCARNSRTADRRTIVATTQYDLKPMLIHMPQHPHIHHKIIFKVMIKAGLQLTAASSTESHDDDDDDDILPVLLHNK